MAGKIFRLGPILLSGATTTNLLNAGTTSGGVNSTAAPNANLQIVIYQIHVANVTGTAATLSLFLGSTGTNTAGTELIKGLSIAANDEYNMYFANGLVFNTADFLVGGSGTASALTLTAVGEIGVA